MSTHTCTKCTSNARHKCVSCCYRLIFLLLAAAILYDLLQLQLSAVVRISLASLGCRFRELNESGILWEEVGIFDQAVKQPKTNFSFFSFFLLFFSFIFSLLHVVAIRKSLDIEMKHFNSYRKLHYTAPLLWRHYTKALTLRCQMGTTTTTKPLALPSLTAPLLWINSETRATVSCLVGTYRPTATQQENAP